MLLLFFVINWRSYSSALIKYGFCNMVRKFQAIELLRLYTYKHYEYINGICHIYQTFFKDRSFLKDLDNI